MRIAVTYDNGEIFQHFGRTENFKIYEVEEGKVVSSEVVSANGAGHEALAGVLANRKVDVLICDGIVRQGEMAELFNVSPATISRKVNGMEVSHA